jgi:DNA-binding SARP family transcriptional activator
MPSRDLSVPQGVIRLRLLGAADLRAADGDEHAEVLKQQKRLALLAYLAAFFPHRFHRRDSLLALFWPELDDSHARAALRRAVHFLRRALGEEVIVSRGDELGVEPDTLWCDVVAFRDALGSGRPEEALELYHGDLLEGFFVPSAPEFEHWLDEERRELRAAAAGAAWTVAEREEAAGNGRAAVRWAQRAAGLVPTDEAALRRLITLLDRLGDRASALQAYEEFARRMAQEFDLEPSPETQAVMQTVRERRGAGPATEAQRAEPSRKPKPNVIAVLPVAVRGSAEFAYLREGIVDLLSAKLDGAGEFRTVDPHALLQHVQSRGLTEIDPDRGRSVAEHFRAGMFLLGSIVVSERRLHVSATIYETRGTAEIRADFEAEHETGVFAIVDGLVLRLLAERITSLGGQITRLAALTTDSLPALKAHLGGERAFRKGEYFEAVSSYERAVAADPTFALGHYRLAAARLACAMREGAAEASASAWEHRQRLAPHASLLLEAQQAWFRGAADDVEALYVRVAGDRPDTVEAWFLLGSLQFDYNPHRGRSVTEARPALERAVSLDPTHVAALAHLVRIAALEQRHDDVNRMVERVVTLSPAGDQSLAMRGIGAFRSNDEEAKAEVLAGLRSARPVAVATAFADIALYAGDLRAAGELAEYIARIVPAGALGALGQIILGHLAAARGDRAAAMQHLATAEKADRAAALEHRALLLTQPFIETSPDELRRLHDGLVAWRPSSDRPPARANLALAVHDTLHPHLRLYLLGLVSARLGDADAGLQYASECAELPPPAEAPAMSRNLSLGVGARVAVEQGEPEKALSLLEQTRFGGLFQRALASPFYALAPERFLRGQVLMTLGRSDDARGWIEGLGQRSPYELVFRGPARQLLDT